MKQFKSIMLMAVLGLATVFTACNSKKVEKKKGGFNLTGTVTTFTEGKIVASVYKDGEGNVAIDTLEVKEGKFAMNYDFPLPEELTLEQADGDWGARLWAENANMTIVGGKDWRDNKVTGGAMQEGQNAYRKASAEFFKTHMSPYEYYSYVDQFTTEKEKKEAEEKVKKEKLAYLDFQKDFIKNNPTNPFGADLIWVRLTSKTGGESAAYLKTWADPIDQNTRKHPYVAKMFRMLNMMLETEAGLEKFVADAEKVTYKVDKNYKGAVHKNIAYLSIFNNNNLCALAGTSSLHDNYNSHGKGVKKSQTFVKIITPDGKEVSKFEVKEEGLPSTIAVDDQDLIYVCVGKQKEEIRKFRGRTSKYMAPAGVKCLVYNKKGDLVKDFMLKGVKQASGARIYQDKLLVSDVGSQLMQIYKKEDGTPVTKLGDLRPCCSILDFDVDKKGNIIVANLGSFRVDAYDLTGKKLVSFGQRGKGINDFWSCCNPVSVRKLDNNCVITVEKTPTRIKVYSKDGAHPIEGIEELVQGCFHIPVISDTKNNIYLASPEKGLVKCVIK
jgi:hypothetical protein